MGKGYTSKPLSFNRRMVRASASVTREKNTVHSFSEVDVTIPRQLIREHLEKGFKDRSIPVKVVGIGPMFNALFTDEEITDFRSLRRCDKKKQLTFAQSIFKKGLFVDTRGTRSYISAVHSDEDLEKTFRIFDEAIKEMT